MMTEADRWPVQSVVLGPCDEIDVLDATWQDLPVWGPGDVWVAMDAPDLAYSGPPHPGLLIRVGLLKGDRLELTIDRRDPPADLQCVFTGELIVGASGLSISPGSVRDVPLLTGNYPVGVWGDADRPEAVRRCVVVLGDRMPYRLGPAK